LDYLSRLASNSVPSDTITDVDNDPLFAIDALTSLHALIRSSFMVHDKTSDAQGAFFEVPSKYKGQKSILFERIKSGPMTCGSSEDDFDSPQFSHYGRNSYRMMENKGYDLTKRFGINFSKEKRTLLRSFVPKGKAPDYYHKIRRGSGYMSTPIPSDFESEESLYHNHSSGTLSWELDVSIVDIFRDLSVKMVSIIHLEDEDEEMIQ